MECCGLCNSILLRRNHLRKQPRLARDSSDDDFLPKGETTAQQANERIAVAKAEKKAKKKRAARQQARVDAPTPAATNQSERAGRRLLIPPPDFRQQAQMNRPAAESLAGGTRRVRTESHDLLTGQSGEEDKRQAVEAAGLHSVMHRAEDLFEEGPCDGSSSPAAQVPQVWLHTSSLACTASVQN